MTSRRRAPRRPERRRRRGLPAWAAVASIGAVAVLLVVGIIALGNVLRGGDGDVPEHTVSAEGRTLGSPDAPVKMVVYLDFQ